MKFSDAFGALSVKDPSFGAVGNGVANDTAAIQACFDAAFGTWASPHGGTLPSGPRQNRAVCFPPGYYLVQSSMSAQNVTGCANDGSGKIRITHGGTSPALGNGDIVYLRNVGGVPNANASYTITDVDSTHFTLRNSTFSGSYTSGGTFCPPALRIKDMTGGLIFGEGRQSSCIEMQTQGAALLSIKGCSFNKIENMGFLAPTGCIALDLNDDGQGTTSLQSNTIANCGIGGTPSTNCEYGCTVGMGQSMGSENLFLNNYLSGCTIAALAIWNLNSIQNTMIGGNIADSRYGIYVVGSGIPNIHGTGFQNQQKSPHLDIYIAAGGANDAYSISGCRSESDNFITVGPDIGISIDGCSHNGLNSGIFYSGPGRVVISGCSSLNGYVQGENAHVVIQNSTFSRGTDYLTAGTGENYAYLDVVPQRIITESGTSRSDTAGADAGAKIQFTSGSASTYTVLRNDDTTTRLVAGAWIEVQQYGAGQVTITPGTGVTLRSSNGLKTRAQYSVVRITVDSTSAVFTVSGDTAV